MIEIDGSHGEGGGQVLRTSLALAAITGQALHIYNIRAGRARPGLQAQHLTSVRAAAAICGAQIKGDQLNSQSLAFRPAHPPQAGEYVFDVTEARASGSAGATTLILQTVLVPLALAANGGESRITLHGGTHAPSSPPFPYIQHVFLPTLWKMGLRAQVELGRYGWYPAGGGEITGKVRANGKLLPIVLTERGELRRVWGTAAVSNLPSHIAQRMANRAVNVLKDAAGIPARIQAAHVEATGPGAGLFLFAEYDHGAAGFTAYGRKGLPSEQVAEMACQALAAHHTCGAAADPHLADQLVLPAALAGGASHWTTSCITRHLLTNAWVVNRFLDVPICITGNEGEPGQVIVGE